MKFKLSKIIIIFVMSFFIINVDALTSSELSSRNACSNFELALANKDGSITGIGCYGDYNSAKSAMDNNLSDDAIILEKVSGNVKVIDAKYALVNLNRGDVLTYIYTNSNVNTSITYMNNDDYYGGVDGAYLGLNYSNKAIKIIISGVTGWLKNGTYTIIPYNWAKSNAYYRVSNTSIIHYYASNIESSNYTMSTRSIGPKVAYLDEGYYSSYDGIYFYSTLLGMLKDYRNNTYDNSVNKDNPYYNYYMYLPHRSKTNYTVDDLDVYIRNVLGFKGSVYGKKLVNNYSTLYGMGEYFINAERLYGANAISVFSLSMNESAKGRSNIAINKNNIFGHDAVDGSAYTSATGYLDVRSSIYSHAYGYINYGYSEHSDSRYYGGHFGNKLSGMNVKYASDIYWGEKAANYYYNFDCDNGMLDYDYYQLAISTTSDINIRVSPNTQSGVVYRIPKKNIPIIILEEVVGEKINDNDIWYKIQTDTNLNDNLTGIKTTSSSNWSTYNWNSSGYVHSSYFMKINDAKLEDNTYHQIVFNDEKIYTPYATKTSYNPIVGRVIDNDIDYYYSSNLLNKAGTIKKNSYLTILEKVTNNDEIRYLVITDYFTYQKHWIDGSNIEIVNKDLLGVKISNSDGYIDIYSNPNENDIGNIYTDNFLPIIDKVDINNQLWLKVQYQVINEIKYGYINTGISNITYTIKYIDKPPVINANDFKVVINTTYDPLKNVFGIDNEDGDITDKIVIISNNVDITKLGTYQITYSLTDLLLNTTLKTVNVEVGEYEDSDPLFMYNNLSYVSDDIFQINGFIGIKGMDNINTNKTLILVNQATLEEYKFNLTSWKEYPYEMSSLDDVIHYNYNDGWFDNKIDLKDIPNGDYTLYVEATNELYKARTLFTNIAYMSMARRVDGTLNDYYFEIDYSSLNSPLLLSIRDNLISYDIPSTFDPMFNFFSALSLNESKMTIKGTSHNIGISYEADKEISRKIIFENKNSFERYEYEIGSITNGDYAITLAVSDNCDKTRAWYNNVVDLSSLPLGDYVVYISNMVDGKTYYGELTDVYYIDYSKVNNEHYTFTRNNNIRLRLELNVK